MKILKIHEQWVDYNTIVLFESEGKGIVNIHNYNEGDTWISGLYVREEYRNEGIATALLDEAEKYAQNNVINIAVHKDAEDWLVNFYKSRNYIITYLNE